MTSPAEVHAAFARTLDTLTDALDLWATRDDTRPQPEVRRAASTAVDEIDAMLRELYLMRGRLVSEIRASDAATAARADALLERSPQPAALHVGCHLPFHAIGCPDWGDEE